MELNEKGLRERKWWTERGYKLPEFDRKAVREATLQELEQAVPKNTAQAVYQYFSQEREKTGER